jgi:ectoine hydroxylase-related dioxygenase (phytanoyl-CoA dioxygenase family)
MESTLGLLDRPYPVSIQQVQAYRGAGFCVLRGVASRDEVAAYRGPIESTAARLNDEARPLHERDTYGQAFLQTCNLWRASAEVKRFVFARRFAGIAADLMGVDRVRLYHDQALFKEGGGGHTPWHQDQYYWPLEGEGSITMWMPLVDLTADMGIMAFAPGSHREGLLADLEISDDSERELEALVDRRGYEVCGAEAMAAGDASFHSGWTLHHAPGNATNTVRAVMTVIYFADGTRIAPTREGSEPDRHKWLGSPEPGTLAAGPLNPVVFDRNP